MRRLGLSGIAGSGPALGKLFAAGRVAVGAAALARPGLLTGGLRIDSATGGRTAWLVRMFAVRDLAVGAGTLLALSRGGETGPWLVASAVSDATDAAALTGAIRRRQVSAPPAALGAGLAVLSVGVQAAAGWAGRSGAGRGAAGRVEVVEVEPVGERGRRLRLVPLHRR